MSFSCILKDLHYHVSISTFPMSKFEKMQGLEAKNKIDPDLELKNLQLQLDANFPEISQRYKEQLSQLSPETLAKTIPKIKSQLGILQGKQDFSKRKTLDRQIQALSTQENETLPNFDFA